MAVGARPTKPEKEILDFVAHLPARQSCHQALDPDDNDMDVPASGCDAPPIQAATSSRVPQPPKARQVNFATLVAPPGCPQPLSDRSTAAGSDVWGPPESVEPATIYKLYRGATGEVHGQNSRVWVDFPALQLCRAGYDLPAALGDRLSLLDLSSCRIRHSSGSNCIPVKFHVDVFSQGSGHDLGTIGQASEAEVLAKPPSLTVTGLASNDALRDFSEALARLLESRDREGKRGLEFIQKRLFQYLWRHAGTSFTEVALYEAQAVLSFNLDPRGGVAYLRGKLGKATDTEVGVWLAQMSTQKGGLDPTMLGAYFSRRDTLEVFKSFVRSLDFRESDLVGALRLLFDTFKPGGEGQVITRILEMFAEAYYIHWETHKDTIKPRTSFKTPEAVEQVAVSLIMLNTGLHVAPKKNIGKNLRCAMMTVEEYIENTRRVVGQDQVPEAALQEWYEAVKQAEISVEPLPRAAFSKLPVQPDIEGWLIDVLNYKVQRRYWAVLALQRLYLFSDANEVEPADVIDLKDARVVSVVDDKSCMERFNADLQHSKGKKCMLCFTPKGRLELVDADIRAFEVNHNSATGTKLLKKLTKPRTRLALVAESSDLMEKWVSLISSGPY